MANLFIHPPVHSQDMPLDLALWSYPARSPAQEKCGQAILFMKRGHFLTTIIVAEALVLVGQPVT